MVDLLRAFLLAEINMRVKDKEFKKFIKKKAIQKKVKKLASRINEDYKDKNPLFIGILNGAFMFASDLMKEVDIPSEISFIRVKSYDKTDSTGKMKKILGLEETIKGRHIIVIEDIVDTGFTIAEIMDEIKSGEPQTLEIVTVLFKPNALKKKLPLKYVGFEIPNEFVVGYGLDYDGYGRNLKDIYQIID